VVRHPTPGRKLCLGVQFGVGDGWSAFIHHIRSADSATNPRDTARDEVIEWLLQVYESVCVVLFGRDAMSDLSPESAPKRTSANAFDPCKKLGR
jgi:hypothetical protein